MILKKPKGKDFDNIYFVDIVKRLNAICNSQFFLILEIIYF